MRLRICSSYGSPCCACAKLSVESRPSNIGQMIALNQRRQSRRKPKSARIEVDIVEHDGDEMHICVNIDSDAHIDDMDRLAKSIGEDWKDSRHRKV